MTSRQRAMRNQCEAALVVCLVVGACCTVPITGTIDSFRYASRTSPNRVELFDSTNNWVATFTMGAYTVTLAGPARIFSERTASASVTHSIWVRTLPVPFAGTVDKKWLELAMIANQQGTPDVLAIAMQYLEGASAITSGERQIAGDACYGPLLNNGKRGEGSDFNDYLGLAWAYADGFVDANEPAQLGCLDCSGYVRMVYGFRHHLPDSGYASTVPLGHAPSALKNVLPRRSFEIYSAAPGVVLIADMGVQPVDLSLLMPGDLVFFDADDKDGTQIDHVGIYLGPDEAGRHRFLSSRKMINGPTMGDWHGESVLNGQGLYSRSWRAARRL